VPRLAVEIRDPSYMPSRRSDRNINHNIEQTASDRPGYFWAFNNGITGLVHDYRPPKRHRPGEELLLSGLAIINGAQTTGALSRSSVTQPLSADASVLARFIRCDDPARKTSKIVRLDGEHATGCRANIARSAPLASVPDAMIRNSLGADAEDRIRRASQTIHLSTPDYQRHQPSQEKRRRGCLAAQPTGRAFPGPGHWTTDS